MKTKETYYLVWYEDVYNGRKNEGVFTPKGWEKWIKEENKSRDDEDKWEENLEMEDNGDFIFTEIKMYN
tara:strand:+ start:498 stop:704 length:207 start_codon:yes stop_codon:yes gene_type:complete